MNPSRRWSAFISILTILAWALISAPGPPEALGVTPSAVLGVWSDGLNGHTTGALEAEIGRTFGGLRRNHAIMNAIPSVLEQANYDAGRTLVYRNAESESLQGTAIPWADIASGVYDWRLAQIVQAINGDQRWTHATPYLFAFHHEPDLSNAFGTPEEYKAAFRHIFDYFDSAGILWRHGGQVEMVWTVTKNALTLGVARKYDPDLGTDGTTVVGDYYDLLGMDFYDKVGSGGHLGTIDPHRAFDPAHQYSLSRGKQFGVFELGVAEGASAEKAAFFSQVVSTLTSYGVGIPGSCAALMYSNVSSKQVYYPDSSPSALTAFAAMANAPYFVG